jgi:hypothetical protein
MKCQIIPQEKNDFRISFFISKSLILGSSPREKLQTKAIKNNAKNMPFKNS